MGLVGGAVMPGRYGRPIARAEGWVTKGRFALTRLIFMVLLATASLSHLIAPMPAEAAGNEARCNELGANRMLRAIPDERLHQRPRLLESE